MLLRAAVTLSVARHIVDVEIDFVDALAEGDILDVGLFDLNVGCRLVGLLALLLILHVGVVHVALVVLETFVGQVPQTVVRSSQNFSFFLGQLLTCHDDGLGGVHRCSFVVDRVR